VTAEEIIADLNERIDKGVIALRVEAAAQGHAFDANRLYGKAEGLLVVKDWLRSY